MKPLALRVAGYLVAAQLIAFFCGWILSTALGLAGVGNYVTSWDSFAMLRAERQVIGSLASDGEGGVRIEPTENLLAELRRAPHMSFAVFDGGKQALSGSDPELASFLLPFVGISPTHTHFALPGDDGFAPEGYMEPIHTRFGRLHVAVHGQKFRWSDIYDVWAFHFQRLAAFLVMAIVLSATAAWFAVRNGLMPLRRVAQEAALIDMNTLGNRLTLSAVPREAMPLVRAINQALERLDVGARRQRLFTANAAHELRTPVAILAARLSSPREANFENMLKRDVWRISHIIQQLLADARADETTLPVDEIIDLAELAQAIVDDAALLAVRDGREIEYLGPSDGVFVRSNKGAIEAVIANLIDNALRAEPEGGAVAIVVDEDATIAVIDHGPGVAEADRLTIFEPFWRKNEGATGAGLGLAIAKELVAKLKGKIWVEDTPGGGATFKLSLPPVATRDSPLIEGQRGAEAQPAAHPGVETADAQLCNQHQHKRNAECRQEEAEKRDQPNDEGGEFRLRRIGGRRPERATRTTAPLHHSSRDHEREIADGRQKPEQLVKSAE